MWLDPAFVMVRWENCQQFTCDWGQEAIWAVGGSQLQLVAEGLISLIDESIKLSPEYICIGVWNSSKQER